MNGVLHKVELLNLTSLQSVSERFSYHTNRFVTRIMYILSIKRWEWVMGQPALQDLELSCCLHFYETNSAFIGRSLLTLRMKYILLKSKYKSPE